jgi:hypothetical protein
MLALTGLFLGCDSSPAPPILVAKGPHQGMVIPLSENTGFVELVNEPEVKDRRSNEPTSIVAYYLQPDAKSALDPVPSDVKFAIDTGAGGRGGRGRPSTPQSIPLNPEPKSEDPAGAGRFASKPGPYLLSALRGTLSAKLRGQPVSVVFQGGR